MPDFDKFLGSRGKASDLWGDHNRAVDVASMIQDHPTAVLISRAGVHKPSQNVIVAESGSALQADGSAGTPGVDMIVLIGVQDHPTLADFDVEKGDRFRLNNTNYNVVMVFKDYAGLIEAHCEAQQ